MKLEHLSRQDALLLLEIIHDSLASRTTAQVQSLLERLRELLPYQAGIAAIGELNATGPHDLTLVNVDYSQDYLAELWRSGLVWQDPILIENFRHFPGLQYWADTFEYQPLLKENRRLAEDFGFQRGAQGHGYGHGVRNRNGTQGSLFVWHGLARDPRTEVAINLVVPHLHEALARVTGGIPKQAVLTPRERGVLQWLAKGKTTWEISMILHISERTVKFHVANIMRKLDATTRAHAVAIGLEQKLIGMD